jgi:hypothetical protein
MLTEQKGSSPEEWAEETGKQSLLDLLQRWRDDGAYVLNFFAEER